MRADDGLTWAANTEVGAHMCRTGVWNTLGKQHRVRAQNTFTNDLRVVLTAEGGRAVRAGKHRGGSRKSIHISFKPCVLDGQ